MHEEAENVAYIQHSFRQHLAMPQGVEHGLRRSIVDEKVACADVWILREAVKTTTDKRQRARVGQLVEDELQDLIWWRCERR